MNSSATHTVLLNNVTVLAKVNGCFIPLAIGGPLCRSRLSPAPSKEIAVVQGQRESADKKYCNLG